MTGTEHQATERYSAGKPGILAFMRLLTDTNRLPVADQARPHWRRLGVYVA